MALIVVVDSNVEERLSCLSASSQCPISCHSPILFESLPNSTKFTRAVNIEPQSSLCPSSSLQVSSNCLALSSFFFENAFNFQPQQHLKLILHMRPCVGFTQSCRRVMLWTFCAGYGIMNECSGSPYRLEKCLGQKQSEKLIVNAPFENCPDTNRD